MPYQQITPDILQWIVAQAQAGHKPEAVLAGMHASGWRHDVALSAIDMAKRGSLVELPPPIAVPEPHVKESPCIVRTVDREIQILASLLLPRVIVFGGLLSSEECDALVESAGTRLQRSETLDNWSGDNEITEGRTSRGTFFTRGETQLLRRIEARIAELLQWPVEHGEGMQLLCYDPGEEFKPHHDFFDPTIPGSAQALNRGGQRVATLLIYLCTPIKGGCTVFPDIGLQVPSIKGNAVFFSYDRPHPVTKTLHGSAPVIEGRKWVATKWLHERAFA